MAEDIAKLGIEIDSSGVIRATKDLKKLDRQSEKNVDSTKSLKRSFIGLKSAAVALAGSLVIKKFIDTAASFETMKISLETVTGSAERATMAFDGIREFAKNTPFQVSEITQAFIKLKALGIQPTESALISFGNTSSAMGKSLNQMIEAVADAATGEFERLKEFGIKARSEGDNVTFTFQGIATTVKKNSEDITEYLESIGQTQFAGAMEKQMDTVNGAFSNAGDAIDNLATALGDSGLNQIVKDITLSFSNMVNAMAGFITGRDEVEKLTDRLRKAQEELAGSDNERYKAVLQAAIDKYRAEIDALTEAKKAAGIDAAGGLTPEAAAEKAMLVAEAERSAQWEIDANKIFDQIEFNEETERLEQVAADRRLEIAKAEADARKSVMAGMFGNLVSLMNSGSKKMFNIGKIGAIAQGLLNLRESVMSAYAAGSEVGGPVVGAAYAATAGLAQVANLAKIKSASFGGGGGGATVSSTTGGQPVTGQLQLEPPSQAETAAPTVQELRVVVEGDGPHSEGMRTFAENLAETIKDMGGVGRLVIS